MKKSPLFLILPLLTLGVLSFAYSLSSERNIIQEAKATDVVEDGKYFLVFGSSFGLSRNTSNNNGVRTSFNDLVTPVYIEKDGDTEKYLIYQYDGTGTKVFLAGDRNNNISPIKFRTMQDITDAESSDSPKEYKFTITESSGLYKFKVGNYYLNNNDNYFKTNSSDPGFQYSLLNVETLAAGVATKIEDISCDNGVTQPSKSEWDEIKDEYDLLSSPIKKYLKTVIYDKDHPYNNIEKQLIKYDYILAKYKNEVVEDKPKYENYLDRTVLDMGDFDSYRIRYNETSYSDYLIAGVLCVATVIIGVTLLNIRRRKER